MKPSHNARLIACKECETGLDASYVYVIPKHKSGRNLFVQAITRSGPGPLVGPAVRR